MSDSIRDRDELIERNRHLVPLTVRRVVPRIPANLEADDLEGAGYLGLIQAADRFDPERGIRFSSFAIGKIRGAVLEYLRQEDWVPRSVRDKQKRGEDVTIVRQVSLEAEREDGEGASVLDHLAAPDASPEETMLRTHETDRVQALIRWLPARERQICERRYRDEMTRREVGEQQQLSESRIKQLEERALRRVRGWVRDRCHDQA